MKQKIMEMSDLENIYGHNITELLTNNDMEINEHDADFTTILTSLAQTPGSKMIIPAFTDVQSSYMNKECEVIVPNNTMDYECHSYIQTTRSSDKPCAKKEGEYREGFPRTLFRLLKQSDTSGYSHIISWLPHGRAFKIHNDKLFKKHVLSKYFESKFESFKRQLYVYGFKKLGKRNTDAGAYFHEHFIRSHKELCCNLKKLNKTVSHFTDEVPNFDKVPRTLQNLNKCKISSTGGKHKTKRTIQP